MSGGAKILGVSGWRNRRRACLAYLNRNPLDFRCVKPIATGYMAKAQGLKDQMIRKMPNVKKDFEDMAAEARDRVNLKNMAGDERRDEQPNARDFLAEYAICQ